MKYEVIDHELVIRDNSGWESTYDMDWEQGLALWLAQPKLNARTDFLGNVSAHRGLRWRSSVQRADP